MSINFTIQESKVIKGVWVISPTISTDNRGNIWTSFLKNEIEHLIPEYMEFKHDKFSRSESKVLRGIHGDSKSWKLVTCVYGEIFQVVVDMRQDSATYLKWQSFQISQDNQVLVLIPPNMGNAYFVCSENAVYHYKLAYDGEYIDADKQFSIKWNDPEIGIKWPTKTPILSIRDK